MLSFFWMIVVGIGGFLETHLGTITAVIAIAAILQWRETRKSSERQLRAYVLVDSAELVWAADKWMAVVKIRNFGETPAYSIATVIEGDWRDRSDVLVRLVHTKRAFKHPSAIMGPKHPFNIPMDFGGLPPNPSDWAIMKNGGKRPFVWGRIDYLDAFDRERWTTFQLFSDLDGFMTLSDCAAGNNADH